MSTTNTGVYIESYLDGILKGEDLYEFEVNLKKDSLLSAELKFQKELRETLNDSYKIKLRKTLNATYLKTRPNSTLSNRRILQAVAAAVVILFIAGGSLFVDYLQTPNTSNIALYNEYFEANNELFTVRSQTSISNAVEEGMLAFNNNEFTKALEIFNKDADNMGSKLYAGFSYMQLKEFNNAEQKFNEIITNNNNLFIDQAEFNLALCHIATSNLDDAKEVLQNIITESNAYSIKAQNLLKSIE